MSQPYDPSLPPAYAAPPQKGWFGRNWWWAVPGGVLLPICLCGGLCFGGVFSVFQGMKNSEAYKLALEATQQSPEVQEALGEPIEETLVPGGNISTSTTEGGHAVLVFRVKGPKGAAMVETESRRPPGAEQWKLTRLIVTPEGGTAIAIVSDEELDIEFFPSEEMPVEERATEESETESPSIDEPATEEPASDNASEEQPDEPPE